MYSRDDIQQALRKLGTRHRGLMLSKKQLFFQVENGLSQDRITVKKEASTKADMAERYINSLLQQIHRRRARGQYN